jgi:hypothetical protein
VSSRPSSPQCPEQPRAGAPRAPVQSAISGASSTNSVRTWLAMLQPTTMTATGLAPGLPAARDIVEHVLKPILVGQDPLSTEKLWDDMFWRCATWRHTM